LAFAPTTLAAVVKPPRKSRPLPRFLAMGAGMLAVVIAIVAFVLLRGPTRPLPPELPLTGAGQGPSPLGLDGGTATPNKPAGDEPTAKPTSGNKSGDEVAPPPHHKGSDDHNPPTKGKPKGKGKGRSKARPIF
jgi:hypothetical protein